MALEITHQEQAASTKQSLTGMWSTQEGNGLKNVPEFLKIGTSFSHVSLLF